VMKFTKSKLFVLNITTDKASSADLRGCVDLVIVMYTMKHFCIMMTI